MLYVLESTENKQWIWEQNLGIGIHFDFWYFLWSKFFDKKWKNVFHQKEGVILSKQTLALGYILTFDIFYD